MKKILLSSPSYNYLKNVSLTEMSKRKFKLIRQLTIDLIEETGSSGRENMSVLFGLSVGSVKFRDGKLKDKKEVLEKIQAQLQPLDILIEKSPFLLTDKFIPGYFGHVSIWMGTKAELVNLGIWNEDYLKPYQSNISSDSSNANSKNEKQIIEALRSGVKMSTLKEFINVDDLLIIRPVFLKDSVEQIKESLSIAFRQVGKEYDFNFDVNTTEKLVCSELAYMTFPMIDWETEKYAGRYTISPDNVARACLDNYPFEVVTFYHNGKECSKEEALEKLNRFVKKKQKWMKN